MKNSEAEKLICVPLSTSGMSDLVMCQTNKCMAWIETGKEIEHKKVFPYQSTSQYKSLEEFQEAHNLIGYSYMGLDEGEEVFIKYANPGSTGYCHKLQPKETDA